MSTGLYRLPRLQEIVVPVAAANIMAPQAMPKQNKTFPWHCHLHCPNSDTHGSIYYGFLKFIFCLNYQVNYWNVWQMCFRTYGCYFLQNLVIIFLLRNHKSIFLMIITINQCFDHRHLRNIDCLMAHTACLVCFISTVNGCSKKEVY